MDGYPDGWMNDQIDGRKAGQDETMNEWMDLQTDKLMDGWMNEQLMDR